MRLVLEARLGTPVPQDKLRRPWALCAHYFCHSEEQPLSEQAEGCVWLMFSLCFHPLETLNASS